jgi:hypothetical protein
LHFMNPHVATVTPAEFPELRMLLWNRDAARPIAAEEAFHLYERNWRHVDTERLTRAEADLIRRLTEQFGNGVFLGRGAAPGKTQRSYSLRASTG